MDAYDKAIEHLNEYPERLYESWNQAGLSRCQLPASILFSPCNAARDTHGQHCACLTQIRSGQDSELPWELHEQIGMDARIPKRGEDINLSHLPLFADYMREADEALGRPAPVLEGEVAA